MTCQDDSVLASRAQKGDQDAFGELVSRHERAMLGIARAYFASEADAEDAVHDAFIKAFENLGQLANGHRFAGWLARITINTCLSMLKSRSDRVSLAQFASSLQVAPRLGQENPTPSTLAGRAERTELLKAAIGQLPESQRVVIMLRYVQHMTYKQLAAYLDVPEPTLRTRAYHARRALRQALNRMGVTSG